ncbi:unnamed protein product, partial [Anisakis simplex]|uniref:Metalloendopeptidase n=1 Tax=Anisakis simplex TaxID=6269 RepID=A0A0M3J015_ANISI
KGSSDSNSDREIYVAPRIKRQFDLVFSDPYGGPMQLTGFGFDAIFNCTQLICHTRMISSLLTQSYHNCSQLRAKRQLHFVFSNSDYGWRWTGIGWGPYVFDPSMAGRYTNSANIYTINFAARKPA